MSPQLPCSRWTAGPSSFMLTLTCRLLWAELFRRVFREDLLVCPRCDGKVVVLTAALEPTVARLILAHLGLPTDPVRIARARAPPQAEFWPDDDWPDRDLDPTASA